MQFGGFADTVAGYVDELKKLNTDMMTKTAAQTKLLGDKAFILAADPAETNLPPVEDGPVPKIDFAPLDAAVSRLKASAKAFDEAAAKGVAPAEAAQVNAILQDIDQSLLDPEGPARSPLVQEPGLCARRPHRLRRQDPAGRARSHRRPPLGRSADLCEQRPPRCWTPIPRASMRRRRR